jgi:hypothetical protein
VGGWWNRRFDPEIDLIGADHSPVARHIHFTGSIKWLTTPFDRHDLAAHHAASTQLPGYEVDALRAAGRLPPGLVEVDRHAVQPEAGRRAIGIRHMTVNRTGFRPRDPVRFGQVVRAMKCRPCVAHSWPAR